MKHKIIFILVVLSLFIWNGVYSDQSNNPLKGITKMGIIIESLPKKVTEIGITEEKLRTISELKIKEGWLSVQDVKYILDVPALYVNVNVVGDACNISLEIREWVNIERDKSTTIRCLVTTWGISMLAMHGNNPDNVVSRLTRLLDKFLEEHNQANPRR